MYSDELAGINLEPSYYFLTNQKNIDSKRASILKLVIDQNNIQTIESLIHYIEEQKEDKSSLLFAAYSLDQLVKLEKKELSPFLRRICEMGVINMQEEKIFLKYLMEIYAPFSKQISSHDDSEIHALALKYLASVEEVEDTELSYKEKKCILLNKKGEIYLEKELYVKAYMAFIQVLQTLPIEYASLKSIVRELWLMVEARQLGVNLKISNYKIDEFEYKLLRLQWPTAITIAFLEDAKAISALYFNDLSRFDSTQRSIIYDLSKHHFNGAFYTLTKYVGNEDDHVDWHFILNILDQIARMTEMDLDSFITDTLNGKYKVEKWFKDIRLYIAHIHRYLLGKSVPAISQTIEPKAKELTNKLQAKKGVKWSSEEWLSTFYRAKAWLHIKKGYYIETFHGARAAKELANLDPKQVETFMNGCQKFVIAKEIGLRLANRHQTYNKEDTPFIYAFMLSKEPLLLEHGASDVFEQIGIKRLDQAIENNIGKEGIFSPSGHDSITVKDASSTFINLVLERIDKRILRNLTLQDCIFSTGLPSQIYNFNELTSLTIQNGNLTHISEEICQLRSLTYLYMSGLPQFKSLPKALGKLSNLNMLQLNLPALLSFPDISSCQQLETLSLTNTSITVFPASICSLKKLKSLNIQSNHFTSIPLEIRELQFLESIKLNNNPWSLLPASLLELPKLQEIILSKEEIINSKMSDELKVRFLAQIEASKQRRIYKNEFYRRIGK